MKCKDCPFWQGTKYSIWADCYRVIGYLQPKLLEMYNDETGERLTIPFDPHDKYRWNWNEDFNYLYSIIMDSLPPGVRNDNEYIQTYKNYKCPYKED